MKILTPCTAPNQEQSQLAFGITRDGKHVYVRIGSELLIPLGREQATEAAATILRLVGQTPTLAP